MEIFIPSYARTALNILRQSGFEGYIVGGCVRDSLLGKKPHDYDVCTDCPPEKMTELFKDFKTFATGLKHGTLTVIIEKNPVEITCYRSDGEYISHRKPAQVKFETSLEEDLKRRDFTVNALAYSPEEGLVDLFGGREDLKNGVLRCVGEAEKRFDEDALRILRGIRFSSCLGFRIEEKTSAAILKQRELLKSISAERIAEELKKLLCGKDIRRVLSDYRDVIAVAIPELIPCFGFKQNNPHHFLDVYGHICLSVENVRPDWVMRLTMLLHDIAKPDMHKVDDKGISHFKKHQFAGAEKAKEILRRLKIDNSSSGRIYDLIWEHDNRIPATRKSVRRFIAQHDFDFVMDYLEVRRADTYAQSDYKRQEKLAELDEIGRLAIDIKESQECIGLHDLAINGNDVTAMGYKGKDIGLALEFALNGVLEEKAANEKEELKIYIEKNLGQEKSRY